MYCGETRAVAADNVLNKAEVGRILVVDDDPTFGPFLNAVLASRGHDVQWASCVADALSNLYTSRYDLLIIDLRLPDGSGIELVRDAADEGLLADSAAIILTGHDFDEPDDIRIFHKPIDIDPFLQRIGEIVAQTKRRRQTRSTSRAPLQRASSNDRRRLPAHKIELVLYTSRSSEKCQKAIRNVRAVLEQYDASQVCFAIRDLSSVTAQDDDDAVVFTPTLVKRGPGPRTWIVGNLDQPELLIDLLEVSGVERKKD